MKNKTSKAVIAGAVLLFAGAAAAAPPATSVYIADNQNHAIRVVNISTGIISTVAGTGVGGFSGDGGLATKAQLHDPYGVAVDAPGNLYIADTQNNRIRMVTTSGIISTVAGTGLPSYSGDNGPAGSAGLNNPTGVAVDTLGNVYIADQRNNRIRMINHSTGIITTVAGNGNAGFSGDGGPATSAQLYYPTGVSIDASNYALYIADTNNQRIREVVAGTITTLAGNGNVGYSCNAYAAATADGLHNPTGVSIDFIGELFVADYGNQCIRDELAGYDIYVLGNGLASFAGDGGPAVGVQLNYPTGVFGDAIGRNFYIADYGNHRIRVSAYSPPGTTYTLAGNGTPGYSGDGGPATSAQLYNPTGVALH